MQPRTECLSAQDDSSFVRAQVRLATRSTRPQRRTSTQPRLCSASLASMSTQACELFVVAHALGARIISWKRVCAASNRVRRRTAQHTTHPRLDSSIIRHMLLGAVPGPPWPFGPSHKDRTNGSHIPALRGRASRFATLGASSPRRLYGRAAALPRLVPSRGRSLALRNLAESCAQTWRQRWQHRLHAMRTEHVCGRPSRATSERAEASVAVRNTALALRDALSLSVIATRRHGRAGLRPRTTRGGPWRSPSGS